MRLHISILTLAVAGACLLPAAQAQNRYVSDKSDKAPKVNTEKHIKSLLKIAADLRRAGRDDVARQLEEQARRLIRKPNTRRAPVAAKALPGETGSGSGGRWVSKRRDRKAPKAKVRKRKTKAGGSGVPMPMWDAPIVTPPRPARPATPARPAPVPTWITRPKTKPAKVRSKSKPKSGAKSKAKTLPGKTDSEHIWRWANRRATAPRTVTERTDAMTIPKGQSDTYTRIPRNWPKKNAARIDEGRERFRYAPVPTGRDASGRVTWKGLPPNPDSARLPVATDRMLERVEALSKEVEVMRAQLERLNKQLDRKRSTIR